MELWALGMELRSPETGIVSTESSSPEDFF